MQIVNIGTFELKSINKCDHDDKDVEHFVRMVEFYICMHK